METTNNGQERNTVGSDAKSNQENGTVKASDSLEQEEDVHSEAKSQNLTEDNGKASGNDSEASLYQDKFNETKEKVKNVASAITSEESKQKITNAVDYTAKKVKGLKGNKKKILIVAVAVILLIAIFGSIGDGIPKEVKEEMEDTIGCDVDDIKLIRKENAKKEQISDIEAYFQNILFYYDMDEEIGNVKEWEIYVMSGKNADNNKFLIYSTFKIKFNDGTQEVCGEVFDEYNTKRDMNKDKKSIQKLENEDLFASF